MDQKGRHILRKLGSTWNFEVGSGWSWIERVVVPIRWLGKLDLSSRIHIWSSFCKFWLLVPLHFVCACVIDTVGSLSRIFHSFFQVTRTMVVHNVNHQFSTSCFEYLVDLEEHIADGCCLPGFDWFIQDFIDIIVIHDHNIQISPAWLVWERASKITENISLGIYRGDGCA